MCARSAYALVRSLLVLRSNNFVDGWARSKQANSHSAGQVAVSLKEGVAICLWVLVLGQSRWSGLNRVVGDGCSYSVRCAFSNCLYYLRSWWKRKTIGREMRMSFRGKKGESRRVELEPCTTKRMHPKILSGYFFVRRRKILTGCFGSGQKTNLNRNSR